ncbi:histidine kinase dimerization/phospho-acceptor domain-containing protein [Paracoccus sp. (in: a-proteobacteria)]|uniref:histidine kinase dimerization/phospho-acceptor domain-containing protein n=1 Tax=Paracoccus sp. TaxID=267 RepID=UPI004058665D
MRRGWSLRGRLVRRLVLGVSLGWLCGMALTMLFLSREMTEFMDDILRDSARVVLATGGDFTAADRTVFPAYRIVTPAGEQGDAPWPRQQADGPHSSGGWRIYRLSRPADGIAVELGQSNEWRRDELLESIGGLVLLMLPVLGLVLWIVRMTVTGALTPALRFARSLGGRRADDLSPVAAADLPEELIPIPDALNGYLGRIGQYVEAERQFATHAAHELRTPLAAASAQAQLMMAGRADAEAPRQIDRAIGRLGRIVERLLELSRAEAGIANEAGCDLVVVLRMMIAEQRPAPAFDDGDLEVAQVAMHPDAAALMIGNVIRNAADHGTGPVRARLRPGPVLEIRNPVAASAGFRQGTFRKSPDSEGVGLGMTIIRKIAERSGVALSFSIQEGEARVRMDFTAIARPA